MRAWVRTLRAFRKLTSLTASIWSSVSETISLASRIVGACNDGNIRQFRETAKIARAVHYRMAQLLFVIVDGLCGHFDASAAVIAFGERRPPSQTK